MTADATPAAIEALEVARFEIEEVGAIGTMEDGTEVITMGVLLSGDEAAIKWAGKHIFSSVVLMRATDHAALAAERDVALRDRDNALALNTALTEANDGLGADAYLANARVEKAETEAAALRDEVARLRCAMQPFDRMAGAMFARNWNRDGVAISFVEKDGRWIRLTFADFLAVTAVLTSKGGEG